MTPGVNTEYLAVFDNFPLFVHFETRWYRRSRAQKCDSLYLPRRCIRERSERLLTLLGAKFTQMLYSRAQRASSDISWCPAHLPFPPHGRDLFTVSCPCSETPFVSRYWHSRKGLSAFSPHSKTHFLRKWHCLQFGHR